MGGFSPSYIVGGVIDEIKKINFPPHLFPSLSSPFTKGFKIEIPAMTGMYEASYTAPQKMELVDVGLACSGYGADDYWEMTVGSEKIIETMYTKELPEHINMGSSLYIVKPCDDGTEIKIQFYNESASSKTVWFNLRFLK